ncbi:hypothetical protein D3C81_1992880 [compost metagenome]
MLKLNVFVDILPPRVNIALSSITSEIMPLTYAQCIAELSEYRLLKSILSISVGKFIDMFSISSLYFISQ